MAYAYLRLILTSKNVAKPLLWLVEIEITHRTIPVLRSHAQTIFRGDPNVIVVGVLKVHPRRVDGSFAAQFVGYRRGTDANSIIQCFPDCVRDFGTAARDAHIKNL